MYLSLCLIAKDENRYLPEWLDYHILLGVEHFWIYDNDSSLPFTETLQPYLQKGWVTVNRIQGKAVQLYAYDHCLQTYGSLSRWIGFIDTDEFIVPRQDGNLAEFLKSYEDYGGLAVSSLFFGAGGHEKRPDCGQVAAFQARTPESFASNLLIKSIVQPARVLYPLSPHCFIYAENHFCVNERRQRVDNQSFPCRIEKIQLNHYFTRSAEEWSDKRKRGRGALDASYNDNPWTNVNRDSVVVDQAALALMAGLIKSPLPLAARLREFSRPESTVFVRELHQAADRLIPPPCAAGSTDKVEKREELAALIDGFRRGLEFLNSGKYAEARELYARLVERFPFDPVQYINFAAACIALKDYPAAWQAIAAAWKISPNDWSVLLTMVDYFYAIGNYEQAEKCILLLQPFGDLKPEAVALLALSQWKQGKHDQARSTAGLLAPQLTSEMVSSQPCFQEMHDLIRP